MMNLIKLYIFCLAAVLLPSVLTSCGGGGGGNDWNFMDRFIPVITDYTQMPAWESWVIAAPVEGDDDRDYSFIARLLVVRDGSDIIGIGNANGYSLGTFAISGTRTQDNIEFKLISQNRYRALELTGKGIYVNSESEIGGNSLTGQDFATTFDDPIRYTGNFQVNVSQLESAQANTVFIGKMEGSYDSIEQGSIQLKTSADGLSITVEEFKGSLVGESATEGTFDHSDSLLFGDAVIDANRFEFTKSMGGDSISIDGAISGGIASGLVVIERNGHVYLGAFSAVAE